MTESMFKLRRLNAGMQKAVGSFEFRDNKNKASQDPVVTEPDNVIITDTYPRRVDRPYFPIEDSMTFEKLSATHEQSRQENAGRSYLKNIDMGPYKLPSERFREQQVGIIYADAETIRKVDVIDVEFSPSAHREPELIH